MDVAWTTNPIGFSERFTIRTDSHQHTNTNMVFTHGPIGTIPTHGTSYGGWPAINSTQSSEDRTRRRRPGAEAVDGRCPESARAGRPPDASNYRTTTPACEAEGCDTHWSRRTSTRAAPRRRHNHKPKTPHQKGHEWTVLGRCRAPLVLVSLSSPVAAPPIQNGCHTSARPR